MDVFQNPERNWLIKHRNLCLAFIKNIRDHNIPIDLQLKNVDAMVEPILLYGSEYEKESTTSIVSCCSLNSKFERDFLLEKIIIFVLFTFTSNFHCLQYK
jgi:hypothetical protein